MDFSQWDPIAFTLNVPFIGQFDIYWYGICYVFGALFSLKLGMHYAKKSHIWPHKTLIPPSFIENHSLIILLLVIFSARLGYALFYESSLFRDGLFNIRSGGLSFHGAFFFLPLFMFPIIRYNKLPFLSTIDLGACVAPIGIMFGRLGNFLRGEIEGIPTDLPWGVLLPCNNDLHICSIYRHPVQIYELLLEGVLLFFILNFLIHKKRILFYPGYAMATFGLCYGIVRCIGELFREQRSYLIGLSTGTFLSLIMILSSMLFFLIKKKN